MITYKQIKYVKYALLLLVVLSVGIVDYVRWHQLTTNAIVENKRDLMLVWHSIDPNNLPVAFQTEWETLDIFTVDPKTEQFTSIPRKEPWATSIAKGEPLECKTQSYRNAVAGKVGAIEDKDYAGVPVISASGRKGDEIVMVEMDVAEAIAVSLNWFHWLDLILSAIICSVIALIIRRVHIKQEKLMLDNEAIVAAAKKALKINAGLKKQLDDQKSFDGSGDDEWAGEFQE